ncbi:MAG: T9SS type A sorting domain-containing protein [Draconibacterium sp.]|nr:T9SS type A sorting domain-containing protein [Draconibacterium sp.]
MKAFKHNEALVFSYAEDIIVGEKLQKSFIMKIEESGDYFLSAYVNAVYDVPDVADAKDKEKKYPLQEIRVYVDNNFFGNLDLKKSGWSSSKLKKNKKINLTAGQHVITFESDMPNTPNVDLIKLSENYEKAEFDNTKYVEFLDKLKANMDKNKGTQRKIEQNEIDAEVEKDIDLKSASNPNSDWEVSPYSLSNPEGNYNHKMTVPVVYTYYKKIYFSLGTNVEFETSVNIPYSPYSVDPVMYLFAENNMNYTWSNDDGGSGYQSKLNVTIPGSGYYYLLIRAYSSSYASTSTGMQGVVDVYKNGSLYQDDAPVSGYMMSGGTNNTGTLNYFTAYSTGTPKLWLAPYGYTSPIMFHGSRYWYVPPMDYTWFDDARFRIVKNTSSYISMYLLVSSEYAWYVYWGNCDLFGSVKDYGSFDSSYFPNLKSSDAMESALATNIYNCASWAGGLTNGWFWGKLFSDNTQYATVIGLEQYGDAEPNNYETWQDYFINDPEPRYIGALYYTDIDANSSNGDIALWKRGNTITHFSVRKEGNQNPHGYDWESKPGANKRLFHPRDALNNDCWNCYGEISSYFREISAPILKGGDLVNNYSEIHSFEESVELGLTVNQTVYLTEEEEHLLNDLQTKLKSNDNKIETLFNNWQTKCKSKEYQNNSNPFLFFDNEECNKLADFCLKNEEVALPYLIDKSFEGKGDDFENQITAILFSGITGKKYGKLMNEVKKEWKSNNYNEAGVYIAPSELANSKNYMKKILTSKLDLKSIVNPEKEELRNSYQFFNIYPNPMTEFSQIKLFLSEESKITLVLYKDGVLIRHIINNKLLNKGEHVFNINRNSMASGMYVCRLSLNNQTFSRKILVL